ncbi:efflux RND transporter periplasmic adaptor subunit [Niabella insulamsoli]|uniref:efflux RND transporter periplasmic adaptor subunit n=1 Tax=Niabella insulamsoli TaxID=3144874 RepID=UPI0031FBE373
MKLFNPLYLTVFLLFSCDDNTATTEVKEATQHSSAVITLSNAQYKNAEIETGKIKNHAVSSIIRASGKIDVPTQNIVSISAPLGGYLKSTSLMPGMYVRKGKVLAIMEDQQYVQLQQDYLTAKAQFSFNESEYNRQKILNEGKASSDKVFEQAKANYQTQIILIQSLEQKLKLIGLKPSGINASNISRSIAIYAPISGYVSAVNVNKGRYIMPSEALFELINPNDIHLELNIFEKDIQKLAVGQKLWAYANVNPEKKYRCKIILINKNISGENAAKVHCHFDQYDKSLIPGMFMNAEISHNGATAAVLPDAAIVRFENKQYAFVSKGKNRFEMVEIQKGLSEDGYTQILNFANFLDLTFVTKGAYNLLMAFKNSD